MKQLQYLGAFCSLIITMTFLIIGPSMELMPIPDELAPYYEIHYYFVLQIMLIGFYLALFGRLRQLNEKKITDPLLIIIALCGLLLINNALKYFDLAYLDYIKITINLAVIAVFMIWLIRIFKTKNYNFSRLKQFGITFLSASGIIILYGVLNIVFKNRIIESGRLPFEFLHVVSGLTGIGFFFGFMFFIKKMPAPDSTSNSI